MTEIQRLMKSRAMLSSLVLISLLIILCAVMIISSLRGAPESWYPFSEISQSNLREDELIRGWVDLDKDSLLIGDVVRYRIRLLWRNNRISPDTETFKGGIGFFPLNRVGVTENIRRFAGNISEYNLEFTLQAVDVDPAQSYTLSPPTVYFTDEEQDTGELQSYRISSPQIHVGEFYPQNVSRIPLLPVKGKIIDPVGLRSSILGLAGVVLTGLAIWLLWLFGRVRRVETLSEPERLWNEFQYIKSGSHKPREYMLQCELIFTDLIMYKLEMNPAEFWSGKHTTDSDWDEIVNKVREIFNQGYFEKEPDNSLIDQITSMLDGLFSQLVEEEKLKIEILPSWPARLAGQPVLTSFCSVVLIIAILVTSLSFNSSSWGSAEVREYNRIVDLVAEDVSIEDKYEAITEFADAATATRVKAAALYNAGTFSATPELVGQDIYQQEALLEVMFQEQRVFLDALLHSLAMEDPFLLLAMIRDGIRFMTLGETALKSAVRIDPADMDIRRNLELIQKRRNAYAETIADLLQEGEESEGTGDVLQQTLMDLEQFMQMEMPEEFAELEEGKDDKDYFILEGF